MTTSKTADRFSGGVVTRLCESAGLSRAARDDDDNAGGTARVVRGHASVFGVEYPIDDFSGRYTEVIAPGAFAETLAAGADAYLTLNHNPLSLGLARTDGGTLRLSEDAKGLAFEADIDLVESDARDLWSKMERGVATNTSMKVRFEEYEWDEREKLLTVTRADLHRGDVSIVNWGANPAGHLRSAAGMAGEWMLERIREQDVLIGIQRGMIDALTG